MAVELLTIMSTVEGLLRYLHGEDYRVAWHGMSADAPGATSYEHKVIYLTYEPLAKAGAPVPDRRVDVVVGVAVHEAGHVQYPPPCPPSRHPLGRLIDLILADAHVDAAIARDGPVMGGYVWAGREYYRDEGVPFTRRFEDPAVLAPDEVCACWGTQVLYSVDLTPHLHGRAEGAAVERALARLGAVSDDAIAEKGRTARGHLDLRRRALRILRDYARDVGVSGQGQSKRLPSWTGLCSFSGRDHEGLPPELAQDVARLAVDDVRDVSAQAGIRMSMIKTPPDLPIVRGELPRIRRDLREAFEQRRLMAAVVCHYQEEGELDPGHLWRRGLGDRDLMRRREIEDDGLALTLMVLVDGSDSMAKASRWETAIACLQGLVEGLQVYPELDLFVMCYNGTTRLYRAFEPGWQGLHLRGVKPDGNTPTQAALRVMAQHVASLADPAKPKLLIHLTDGMPNEGSTPEGVGQEVAALERSGARVLGIGIGVDREVMAAQYRRWAVIDDARRLPAELQRLVARL